MLEWGEDPNLRNLQGKFPIETQFPNCNTGKEALRLFELFDEFHFDFTKVPCLLHQICKPHLQPKEHLIEFLLKKGVSVCQKDELGKNPLDYLNRTGPSYKCFHLLISAGASIERQKDPMLQFYFACIMGNLEEASKNHNLIFEKLINIVRLGFIAALRLGHTSIVKYILRHDRHSELAYGGVEDIQPPEERRHIWKMIFLRTFMKASDQHWMRDVARNDFPFFLELYHQFSTNQKEDYLGKYQYDIVEEIFLNKNDLSRFEPLSYWENMLLEPIKNLIDSDASIDYILELCKTYRLFYCIYQSETLFEYVCKKMDNDKCYELFFRLYDLICALPIEEKQRALVGNPLIAFMSCRGKIKNKDLSPVWDILFSIHLNLETRRNLFLQENTFIYWNEIKDRLKLLKFTFKGSLRSLLKVANDDYMERPDILKDMIHFCWNHGGNQEKYLIYEAVGNSEISPFLIDELHSLGAPLDEFKGVYSVIYSAIKKKNPHAAFKLIEMGARCTKLEFDEAREFGFLKLSIELKKRLL